MTTYEECIKYLFVAPLTLWKAWGVITENTLLLKYEKQVITAALIKEDALMLLPTASGKCGYTKCCPLLSVSGTSPIGNKISDWNIY